jgi:hypothetical protein
MTSITWEHVVGLLSHTAWLSVARRGISVMKHARRSGFGTISASIPGGNKPFQGCRKPSTGQLRHRRVRPPRGVEHRRDRTHRAAHTSGMCASALVRTRTSAFSRLTVDQELPALLAGFWCTPAGPTTLRVFVEGEVVRTVPESGIAETLVEQALTFAARVPGLGRY